LPAGSNLKSTRVARIACNLGAEGMGGCGSVIDASEATSHRCATPVASNWGHPRTCRVPCLHREAGQACRELMTDRHMLTLLRDVSDVGQALPDSMGEMCGR